MSKSFMDAIRGVVTEGAKEKTADGMTKDAKHFIDDLHKVQDSGMKHLVQKDSEAKDYEKMFSGDVDRAPSNRGSYAPGEDVDKYVEYNEHLEIEEAKKAEKHDKDCECEDCSSEDNDVKEEVVSEDGNPNKFRAQAAGLGVAKPAPLSATQKMGQAPKSPMGGQGTATPAAKPAPKPAMNPRGAGGAGYSMNSGTPKRITGPVKSPMAGQGAAAPAKPAVNKFRKDSGPAGGFTSPQAAKKQGYNYNIGTHGGVVAQKAPEGKKPQMDTTLKSSPTPKATTPVPPKPKLKPEKPAGSLNKKSTSTSGLTPPKASSAKPAKPAFKGNWKGAAPTDMQAGIKTKRAPGTGGSRSNEPMGPKRLNQSFEIDINGTSYLVSEAHASAIAAFVEKYGIVEGTAGEFIHKEMQHPERLTARGKRKKIEQSLAIYYSKKRRGENP